MNNLEEGAEQAMGGNMEQNATKDMSGGGGNQQGGSGGGGGMDGAINSGAYLPFSSSSPPTLSTRKTVANCGSCLAVDKFASSEGVPGAADGMINKEVDSEVNKFT
jgi:hypothetical protein